ITLFSVLTSTMMYILSLHDALPIYIHSPIVLGNIAQIVAGSLRKPVIVTNHYLPINLSRSLSSDPLFGKPFMTVTYSYLVHFCRSEEHTSELQSHLNLVCRLLLDRI